jgi:hypothetical protein
MLSGDNQISPGMPMPSKSRRRSRLSPILTDGRPNGRPNPCDIPEARRRAIYVALAEARRAGLDTDDVRYAVARMYVLTILKVEAIEQEGLDRGWPVA